MPRTEALLGQGLVQSGYEVWGCNLIVAKCGDAPLNGLSLADLAEAMRGVWEAPMLRGDALVVQGDKSRTLSWVLVPHSPHSHYPVASGV